MAISSTDSDSGAARPGALGALLAISAILLLSALVLTALAPPAAWLRTAATATLAAALASCLAAWFLYAGRLLPAIRRLSELGEGARDQLEALSAGIARLSTGNLAASVAVPPPERPATLPASLGALAGLARTMQGISSGAREGIEGFDEITNEPSLRTFYVGSDSFAEGLAAGEAIGRILKGRGRVCAIVGDERSITYKLRTKGAAARLAEKYPGVELVETVETRESDEATHAAVLGLIRKYRDLECVYVAEGCTPPSAGRAVIEARREGKTAVVAHDTTDETMRLVAKGVIGATISQDPYAQGHDAVVRLYNRIAAGWKPTVPRFLTRLETVTPENCSRFWSEGAGAVYADRSHLASPLAAAGGGRERVRIAVVCSSGAGFWQPLRQGVMDAKAELAPLGAEVEWITPPPELENDRSISTYAPIIERLVREGRQGIAIPIFSSGLIPAINEAARAGVAVGSFNSEPVSLREMVSAVKDHADSLIGLSQDLAASAEQTGQSTQRIGETMDKIGASIESQLGDASRTGEELRALVENIGRVNEAAEESAESARGVAASSAEGVKSVSQMRKTVRSLEEASSLSESTIRSLKDDTDRIGSIVASIAEVSNQTNVLAINASIQAARAGERGKGFAVIAAEIRKLADQSNRATQEIASLISLVQGRVASAGEATGRGLAQARENSAYAELSEKSLRDISSLAGENERRMELIRGSVEGIAKFSGRVEETVRSLTATNRRSEDASLEVRSSTQEMAAQAGGVANAALALAQMAKDQQLLLSQFRIDRD